MPDQLLTDAEIDEIRGRAEAATPGPWRATELRLRPGVVNGDIRVESAIESARAAIKETRS